MLEGSYRLSSSELSADESKMGRVAEVFFLLKQRMIILLVSIIFHSFSSGRSQRSPCWPNSGTTSAKV